MSVEVFASLAAAIEGQDAKKAAACFAIDATYDDGFYGVMHGRSEIEAMFGERWFVDGGRFRWSFLEPVVSKEWAYARYLFSYTSRLRHTADKRAVMSGCCQLRLSATGEIGSYRDWTTGAAMLVDLGTPTVALERILRREHASVVAQEEAARHLLDIEETP
jgi:hypothetical protein